jgi:hypothetical protein
MPPCMQDPQSLFTGLVESTGEKSAKVLREIAARSGEPPLSFQGHIPSHTDYTIPEDSPLPSLSSLDVSHHAFDHGFRRSGGATPCHLLDYTIKGELSGTLFLLQRTPLCLELLQPSGATSKRRHMHLSAFHVPSFRS